MINWYYLKKKYIYKNLPKDENYKKRRINLSRHRFRFFVSLCLSPVSHISLLTFIFIAAHERVYIFGHSCYTVVLQNVGTPYPWEITWHSQNPCRRTVEIYFGPTKAMWLLYKVTRIERIRGKLIAKSNLNSHTGIVSKRNLRCNHIIASRPVENFLHISG